MTALSHRLRIASVLTHLWHHPTRIHGSGMDAEASLEHLLRTEGWRTKEEYVRHPNGTHRWPDFHLLQGPTLTPLALELKTTRSDSIHLGGTWPHPDAVYVIRHHRPETVFYVSPASTIADAHLLTLVRGQDLVTEKDRIILEAYQRAIRIVPRLPMDTTGLHAHTRITVRLRLDRSRREEWYQRVLEGILRGRSGSGVHL